MPTTKSGYCNGSDLLLKIGENAIGHCTSHTVTMASETKDRAVKPLASAEIGAGLWKDKGVSGLSISVSGEGLIFYADTESGYKTLVGLWKAGAAVTVECFERESDSSPYLEGSFVITNLEMTAPAEDDATYSIQLENSGMPTTLDPTKLT